MNLGERKTYLYPLHCQNCFKKLGTSPHNFANKMVYCEPHCFVAHRRRTKQIMEENTNDEKNSSSSIKK